MPHLAATTLVRESRRLALLLFLAAAATSCRAFDPSAAATDKATTPPMPASAQTPAPPIPSAQLAQRGFVLTTAPSGTTTTVTEPQAESIALSDSTLGTVVLNSALMTLNDSGSGRASLCWIFSVNSGNLLPGGPYNSGAPGAAAPVRANFEVIAVDASTGALILHVEGHDPTLPELPAPNITPSSGGSPSP